MIYWFSCLAASLADPALLLRVMFSFSACSLAFSSNLACAQPDMGRHYRSCLSVVAPRVWVADVPVLPVLPVLPDFDLKSYHARRYRWLLVNAASRAIDRSNNSEPAGFGHGIFSGYNPCCTTFLRCVADGRSGHVFLPYLFFCPCDACTGPVRF